MKGSMPVRVRLSWCEGPSPDEASQRTGDTMSDKPEPHLATRTAGNRTPMAARLLIPAPYGPVEGLSSGLTLIYR